MLKIKPSNRNTNKHTDKGMSLLENSIDTVGVIESVSVTEEGTIISGHARKELFDKKGFKPKYIKLADNEYPVIETDIKDNTKQYYQAQILANTTAKQNYNLDIEEIEVIAEEYDIDIEECGVEVELKENQELQKNGSVKELIKPYNKTHILLSFNPEKIMELKPYLDKILLLDDIDYEQSSN